MTLSRNDAENLLKPARPVLAGALRGAVSDWAGLLALQNSAALTGGISNRTRAGYIHDRAVYRLLEAEAQRRAPGLHMVKIRGLWVAVVRDQLVLKLKKLDKSLRSRNIPTLQTQLFDAQGSLLPRTAAAATNATGGYVIDPLTTTPINLVAVCWEGGEKRWEIPLEVAASSQAAVSITLPLVAGPAGPSTRRARTRVANKQSKSGDATAE